jgi:DNA-binding MarR family transcriptional regulator
MDFQQAARLGACLAKDYAPEMLRLLVNYRSLSASEAASRLNLHVQTAQSFLESLESLGILEKQESREKSRPYYRFTLKTHHIRLDLDLTSLAEASDSTPDQEMLIRERKGAGARFVTARGGGAISSVTVWTGKGRSREERKLNLTATQGVFLFHLPFPGAEPLSVADIIRKAGLDGSNAPEIQDIVDRLESLGVIEKNEGPGG